MKRLWVAVIIFVIVVGACVWGRQYQVYAINDMVGQLDQINSIPKAERKGYADEFKTSFERHATVLACYMNHDDVDSARNAVVDLYSAIYHQNEEEILTAKEALRAQLLKLRNIDSVRIENVL